MMGTHSTEPPGRDAADPAPEQRGLGRRLGWFVVLYLASAFIYAVAVYGLRLLVPHP